MGYVVVSSVINASSEAVWNCLNDIDHTPEWVTGLEAAEIKTPGPYGMGSIYVDYNRLGPFRQETPWHITAFEPMTRQVHQSKSASLPSTMTLNIFPLPQGVRLEMRVEYRFLPGLGPLSRLLERLFMNRMLAQVITQNQASLNDYLRQRSASERMAGMA